MAERAALFTMAEPAAEFRATPEGDLRRLLASCAERPLIKLLWDLAAPDNGWFRPRENLCYVDPLAGVFGRWGRKMPGFFYLGAALGLVLGAFHAIYVYRRRIAAAPAEPLAAVYYAAWTLALWTLFGAYVLFFWLIGAAGMGIARLRRSGEAL